MKRGGPMTAPLICRPAYQDTVRLVERTARLVTVARLVSLLRRRILRVVVVVIGRLLLRIGLRVVDTTRAGRRRVASPIIRAVCRIDVAIVGTLSVLTRRS